MKNVHRKSNEINKVREITFWINVTHGFGWFIALMDTSGGCDDNITSNTCTLLQLDNFFYVFRFVLR